MCDEWCCTGTAGLSPPLIVTSLETKKRKKAVGGGGKHPAAQAAEAVDASFHHLTHKRAHTHADAPFSPHKSTGTNIKAHTHSNAHSLLLSQPDNLYPTAVCIC